MSNSRTQRGSLDIESEILPQDPPSWIVRWTAWLLLGVLFLAFVGAIVLKLPETVHCPFVLVPATGTDPIQSPHQGILSRVSVAEGEVVKKGAELFVLRSDEIRGLGTQFRTLNEDLRRKEESLMQSDSAYKAQANIKEAEIDQAKNEVRFRENYAKTSHDLVERMGKLAQEGSSSEINLVRMKLDLAGSEKDLSVAQKTLQQVNLDRQRMEMEHSRLHGEQQAEIEKFKMRIGALKADLENSQDNLRIVRSPYDGVVISLNQRTVGSVVQQGQVLCQLLPQDAQPRARMIVNEAGLARLAVAQRVRFFFEAYPFQRYGVVGGKLDWISNSAVTAADGSRFVALASLDRADIPRPRGKSLPLRMGMRGDAHIIVGDRTPIEYALEPIHRLRESMRQ
jgi:multidrug efflux pump subunit AcrA (membrane-fusion protein)